MKRLIISIVTGLLLTVAAALWGGAAYLLDYALAPEPGRTDTARCLAGQFERYPEVRPWYDSLMRHHALRDTMVMMPRGERHHAYRIDNGSRRTALVIHGWRNCAINMLFIGRLYDSLGYNVVLPDLHAHGLSEGDAVGMGWQDRLDMLHWLSLLGTDTVVVHGISMGGATTMMMSASALPEGIVAARFVDDCGYTSAWDEFADQLKQQFGLPPFPLLYAADAMCRWRYGWGFKEASAIGQVARSQRPMLFIHGDADELVPVEMAHRLARAKADSKQLWITHGVPHAMSYQYGKRDYVDHLVNFLSAPVSQPSPSAPL